jgi:membrane-associated phospholipid phosphatase
MKPLLNPRIRFLAIAAIALVLAHLADGIAYRHIVNERVLEEDWGRMLRVMGFLPFWLLAAAALVLHDRGDTRRGASVWMRGGLLLGSVAAAGIAGEVLKIVIRRERPRAHEGAYFFRPWSDRPLSSGGLSTPSSHAIIAFGAACMLARLFPRAALVWYLLAAGCALTRVMQQAHFLSDVVLSALVAWLIASLLWRRYGPARDRAVSPAADAGA